MKVLQFKDADDARLRDFMVELVRPIALLLASDANRDLINEAYDALRSDGYKSGSREPNEFDQFHSALTELYR